MITLTFFTFRHLSFLNVIKELLVTFYRRRSDDSFWISERQDFQLYARCHVFRLEIYPSMQKLVSSDKALRCSSCGMWMNGLIFVNRFWSSCFLGPGALAQVFSWVCKEFAALYSQFISSWASIDNLALVKDKVTSSFQRQPWRALFFRVKRVNWLLIQDFRYFF